MRIALVGTGQMGQAVERQARDRGHEVVARFDSGHPLTDAGALDGADAAIDFSLPDVALGHLRCYARWGGAAVVGTTGWYDRLDDVRGWMEEGGGAVLYAPNFSLGVALLVRALRATVPLLEALPDFDAFVHEVHHVKKVDSPSGTARMLAEVLVEGLSRKDYVEAETQHGRIDPEALHVSSTRAGAVYGRHTVGLDGPFDYLTLTHEAKSREGFAYGALHAAEWLPGRRGLFTLDDLLDDWTKGNIGF